MLKIIYSETGFHLELLSVDRQEWIDRRVEFAASMGEVIIINQQRATFLLPASTGDVTGLAANLLGAEEGSVTWHRCDCDYVEIGLDGEWICADMDGDEGVFIARLPDRIESYLWELWHAAMQELVS